MTSCQDSCRRGRPETSWSFRSDRKTADIGHRIAVDFRVSEVVDLTRVVTGFGPKDIFLER